MLLLFLFKPPVRDPANLYQEVLNEIKNLLDSSIELSQFEDNIRSLFFEMKYTANILNYSRYAMIWTYLDLIYVVNYRLFLFHFITMLWNLDLEFFIFQGEIPSGWLRCLYDGQIDRSHRQITCIPGKWCG